MDGLTINRRVVDCIYPAVKLILAALIFWNRDWDALIFWITALALSVLGIIDRSHGGRWLKGLP